MWGLIGIGQMVFEVQAAPQQQVCLRSLPDMHHKTSRPKDRKTPPST
jgi:hypothetical protein